MTELAKSIFSGMPKEYAIPRATEVVFVNDYFVREVAGGAELTSEAIIKKSPYKVFRLHSSSVTKKLLDENKDKYWVFGNFVAMTDNMIQYLPDSGVRYSVIEYDFKFCSYRSTARHQQDSGEPCNCAKANHGMMVARLFRKADRIFWMSVGQKTHWLNHVPSMGEHPGHVILSSVFDDETLNDLALLRSSTVAKKPKFAVLGSGSWIKGAVETQKWCAVKKKDYEVIPALAYKDFLQALATYKGFVFMPLDKDTCPRVTLEAKLLGLELITNENVLQKYDEWFTGSVEECETYLRSRAQSFWQELPVKSS